MASLRGLSNSPFWIACFTLPDGRRTNRSTGAKDKRQAQRIATQYEDTARGARQGRFIEARARKAIAHIFAIANKDTLASSTTGDFIASWLKHKELEAGASTHVRYEAIMEDLREFLGARTKLDIAHLTVKEITQFRDALARRLMPGSVNVSLKLSRLTRSASLVSTSFCRRVLRPAVSSVLRPHKWVCGWRLWPGWFPIHPGRRLETILGNAVQSFVTGSPLVA